MIIKNECSNLHKRIMRHVQHGLDWINPHDLVGVERIRLVDKLPEEVILDLKVSKASIIRASHFAGLYRRKNDKYEPQILLRIPLILEDIHPWLMHTTVPTLLIARVLAHEVGHHLVKQRGYVFEPTERKYRLDKWDEYEEEMVDRYAFEVVRRMKAKWKYKFGDSLIDFLSDWYAEKARLHYKNTRYKLAERFSRKALVLNSDNEQAYLCYWNAKKNLEEEKAAKRKSVVKTKGSYEQFVSSRKDFIKTENTHTNSGFRIIENVILHNECEGIIQTLANLKNKHTRAGARHLMSVPLIADLANDERLLAIARQELGKEAFPFRATLFAKSGKANWLVVWHQDTALPLRFHHEETGWTSWSKKENIWYARARDWALSRVVALRLHLDPSTEENGSLRVVSSSHTLGVLEDDEIKRVVNTRGFVECHVGKGGVLVMRPLLLHASSKAKTDVPRRVLHIEYADSLRLAPNIELAVV